MLWVLILAIKELSIVILTQVIEFDVVDLFEIDQVGVTMDA